MPDRRFRQRDRVKHSDDFTRIIRGGAFAADDLLVVNVRWRLPGGVRPGSPPESPLTAPADGAAAMRCEPSRLGISIPKKTGPAVIRNRWKRWIREAFRQQRERIPLGLDIIVRPKRGASGSFEAITRSLPNSVRRAKRRLEQTS